MHDWTTDTEMAMESGRLTLRAGTRRDDVEIRRLLREVPVPGAISITVEYEVPFFDALDRERGEHEVIVAEDPATNALAGVGVRSVRDVWINAKMRRAGHLSGLYVDPRFRARPRLIADGFRALGRTRRGDGAGVDIAAIATDNRPALRLLRSDAPGLPRFHTIDRIVNVMVFGKRWRRRPPRDLSVKIERVRPAAVEEVVACLNRHHARFQFAPALAPADLANDAGPPTASHYFARRVGRVVGCLATWDRRAERRMVVASYGPRLERFRGLYNAASRLSRSPKLPEPGEPVPYVYGTRLAVESEDGQILIRLIEAALSETAAPIVLTLSARRRALLETIRRRFVHRITESDVFAVGWNDEIDAGPFRTRPVHVDAGTL